MVRIDIEMPKSCKDCDFCHEIAYEEMYTSTRGFDPDEVYICGLLDTEVGDSDNKEEYAQNRYEDCPLLPEKETDEEHIEKMSKREWNCPKCGRHVIGWKCECGVGIK